MAELPVATLPPNWAAFVDLVTLGSDPADAATTCGYENPKRASAALLRHPQVRKALAAAAEARLQGVSLPLALDTVDEILRDKTAPKAVRAKLALGLVDRLVKRQDAQPLGGKSLADMTPRELEQLVAQLGESGARPGQMLDVTPEPKPKGDKDG